MIALLRIFAVVAGFGSWICQAHAELRVDVPYGPAGAENTLDIRYQPGQPSPLIVFVHGGGWDRGDKKAGTRLLAGFAPAYAYASVNYRLAPQATIKDEISDVALAVAYLQKHAAEYSIDPKRIVLMGHSAGAHLVAVAALDSKYFAEAGVSPGAVRAVVLLDCGGCGTEIQSPRLRATMAPDPERWKAYSPTALAARSAQAPPPFLITYAPDRQRSANNAQPFAAALAPHCGACVLKGYSKEHMSFLRDMANRGDPMTTDVAEFLNRHVGR